MLPLFFFFNAPATTDIYTLSLHDALPICPSSTARRTRASSSGPSIPAVRVSQRKYSTFPDGPDRKSTRLNSSHRCISYAVFCLKKKKKIKILRNNQNHNLI